MSTDPSPTNWVLVLKGGILAFLLNFMLYLLLDGTEIVVLTLMNFGSVFVGGLYVGRRTPSRELYHGMLAGLVKGLMDQSLLIVIGQSPSYISIVLSASVGLLGGFASRHLPRSG